MSRPDVIITLGAGGLGRIVATEDGTSGIIVSGVAVAGKFALDEVLEIQSLQQAIELGITAEYDVTNTCLAYRHIADFYDQALNGTKLFVMVVSKETTMADLCLKTEAYAKKLLAAGNGEIKLLAVTRVPDDAYVPVYADEFDEDLAAAITNAQALRDEEFNAPFHRPVQIILEGRDFQGNASASLDLRTLAANRVSVVIGQDTDDAAVHAKAAKYAFAGYILGRVSANSVQRNIGRIRSGQISKTKVGYSNGAALETLDELKQGTLNEHGYIFAWKHAGKAGFYINDDHTAVVLTDDYAFITRGRTMDKAARIVRSVLLEELLDDVELNQETGKLEVSVIKSIQGNIESELNAQMAANGEISGTPIVYIDPDQNVLSTDNLDVEVSIVPKGMPRRINALLQYSNPLSN